MGTARLDRRILFSLVTSTRFERLARSTGWSEDRCWSSASRYVAGADEESGIRLARDLAERGLGVSLDRFGEHVSDPAHAQAVTHAYRALAQGLDDFPERIWLSIDLSHIGLDLDTALCRSYLEEIAEALPPGRLLQVGAEDAARADRILDVVLSAAGSGAALGCTLQANLIRSERDAEKLAEAGMHVRLVKGAYVERSGVARPYGEETDAAFVRLAHQLGETGSRLALATHDQRLFEALLPDLPEAECELLLGVREGDADRLAREGRTVRLYVPFGANWFRYWMRRLAESRGAPP